MSFPSSSSSASAPGVRPVPAAAYTRPAHSEDRAPAVLSSGPRVPSAARKRAREVPDSVERDVKSRSVSAVENQPAAQAPSPKAFGKQFVDLFAEPYDWGNWATLDAKRGVLVVHGCCFYQSHAEWVKAVLDEAADATRYDRGRFLPVVANIACNSCVGRSDLPVIGRVLGDALQFQKMAPKDQEALLSGFLRYAVGDDQAHLHAVGEGERGANPLLGARVIPGTEQRSQEISELLLGLAGIDSAAQMLLRLEAAGRMFGLRTAAAQAVIATVVTSTLVAKAFATAEAPPSA